MHGSEGAAAVVTRPQRLLERLRRLPIAITVKDPHGRTLYQNNAPGLEAALTSIASLPAHGEVTWVDDQIPASGEPASVSAIVGEATAASGAAAAGRSRRACTPAKKPAPRAGGTVRNLSNGRPAQARRLRGGAPRRRGSSAAGRAVLAEVAPGASAPFQVFFVGDPERRDACSERPRHDVRLRPRLDPLRPRARLSAGAA